MNILAIDIGNTNIEIGLFLDGREEINKAIPGADFTLLLENIKEAWSMVPMHERAKEQVRDGVIVASSVKKSWSERLAKELKEQLGEKVMFIGSDIPLPIEMDVDEPAKVGTDRVIAAAAAYAVVQDAVVVADFGTAVTIDLVNDEGVFLGGAIIPGFYISGQVLQQKTAQLPFVEVTRPQLPYGRNTNDAINCGLYYAAIGALSEITRRYAEHIGKWPHTVITGAGAELIKEDTDFVDSCVPHLVTSGIALAYKRYLEQPQ